MAMAKGISSPFENELWLDLDPPAAGLPDATKLRRLNHRTFIKLPRLTVYLRELRTQAASALDLGWIQPVIEYAAEVFNIRDDEAASSVPRRGE